MGQPTLKQESFFEHVPLSEDRSQPTQKQASFVEHAPLVEDRSRNKQANASPDLLQQDSINFSDYEPENFLEGFDGENDPFNQSFMSNFSITTDRDGEQSKAKHELYIINQVKHQLDTAWHHHKQHEDLVALNIIDETLDQY